MQKNRRRRSRCGGFTLIELMVVLIVIAILAVTVIPQFSGTKHDARVSRSRADLAQLENALERFFLHMDRYPTTAEGLDVLVNRPSEGAERWRGYISRLVKDPWNSPYRYRSPGTGNRPYDLWSAGADGADGGEGEARDISNWDNAQ